MGHGPAYTSSLQDLPLMVEGDNVHCTPPVFLLVAHGPDHSMQGTNVIIRDCTA